MNNHDIADGIIMLAVLALGIPKLWAIRRRTYRVKITERRGSLSGAPWLIRHWRPTLIALAILAAYALH